MKVEKIDHIHVKIDNMKSALLTFEGILGTKFPMEMDFSSNHGLRMAFNPFPLGIELLEVTDISKEMGTIYADAPQGVFALSLKVQDIEKAIAEMESMGHKMLLRYGFGQMKEALFDCKKTIGLFLELVEYPGEDIFSAARAA